MINKLVGPKFENEQRTDKGSNAVSDDIAVGHFPLIRRVSVGRTKRGYAARESQYSNGDWASLQAKLYARHLLQCHAFQHSHPNDTVRQ